MDTTWLRHWGRRAADWGVGYRETIRERPVRAQVSPGDIARQIPVSPPDRSEDMATIFAVNRRAILTPVEG